tara:strand:+ start:352 stop:537 length:186 start_codon:yes stop_codon:yes gene_type:complete
LIHVYKLQPLLTIKEYLKMIERKQTKLKVNQKSPHSRGLLVEILVFSVVAGEGFEPPTFRL